MTSDLSVIIVNWNTELLLSHCLHSVYYNLGNTDIEVVVVDNGSTDSSVEMVQTTFPKVVLIKNQENYGFAKANNQAIRLSQGRYLVLLNSDAFLRDDSILSIVTIMETDPSVGVAGPRLLYPDGSPQRSHGPLPNLWTEVGSLFGLDKLRFQRISQAKYEETGWVNGACMVIRKTLLDQIGLLDEAFFMFNEEIDFCNRCHKAGSKVISVPSATVFHVGGGSTDSTIQRILRLYNAKLLYFKKHFGLEVEYRLWVMMKIAAIVKGSLYSLLRIFSFGRIEKGDFWWSISKELNIKPR